MRNRHNRKRYPEGINSPLPVTVWRKGRAEECDPSPFIPSRRQRQRRGQIGTRADSDRTGSIAETEGVAPDHSPPRSRHPHTHVAKPLVQAVTLEFHYITKLPRSTCAHDRGTVRVVAVGAGGSSTEGEIVTLRGHRLSHGIHVKESKDVCPCQEGC